MVVSTRFSRRKGGTIHIKPENRGKFTASAKKMGHSVQQHARHILGSSTASPLQKKRANFARNSKKWKKPEGGKIVASESTKIDQNLPIFKNKPLSLLQMYSGGGEDINVSDVEFEKNFENIFHPVFRDSDIKDALSLLEYNSAFESLLPPPIPPTEKEIKNTQTAKQNNILRDNLNAIIDSSRQYQEIAEDDSSVGFTGEDIKVPKAGFTRNLNFTKNTLNDITKYSELYDINPYTLAAAIGIENADSGTIKTSDYFNTHDLESKLLERENIYKSDNLKDFYKNAGAYVNDSTFIQSKIDDYIKNVKDKVNKVGEKVSTFTGGIEPHAMFLSEFGKSSVNPKQQELEGVQNSYVDMVDAGADYFKSRNMFDQNLKKQGGKMKTKFSKGGQIRTMLSEKKRVPVNDLQKFKKGGSTKDLGTFRPTDYGYLKSDPDAIEDYGDITREEFSAFQDDPTQIPSLRGKVNDAAWQNIITAFQDDPTTQGLSVGNVKLPFGTGDRITGKYQGDLPELRSIAPQASRFSGSNINPQPISTSAPEQTTTSNKVNAYNYSKGRPYSGIEKLGRRLFEDGGSLDAQGFIEPRAEREGILPETGPLPGIETPEQIIPADNTQLQQNRPTFFEGDLSQLQYADERFGFRPELSDEFNQGVSNAAYNPYAVNRHKAIQGTAANQLLKRKCGGKLSKFSRKFK